MANWVEPKSNYVATDQVTPDIFNTLAENEKFLYEIRCPMEVHDSDGNVIKINSLVFVETTTDGVYKAKYKKSDGTFVEIPIESAQTVKLRSSRSIGIQGLDAESASFNGTSAVKIKVTGVPAELLHGTASIDITGSAATAFQADSASRADFADGAGSAVNADNATDAAHANNADQATKLSSSWTAYTTSTYLTYGTYIFQVVIDDQELQAGGHAVSFSDIITVNSYAYNGINPGTRYNNDYITGADHVYNANAHETTWYRTARLKVTYMNSTQFRINLFISSGGGYALSTTDVKGSMIYPGTEANSVSGITYQIYYKKIM